jgi:integrase
LVQTLDQVKQEIYDRISIIAEPRAKYTPGTNKRVDALMVELRQIAGKRAAGQPILAEDRPRFSEIVTELHLVHGIPQNELSRESGIGRKNISNYIRPKSSELRPVDETRTESKESLLAELDLIMGRKVSGKAGVGNVRVEDKPRLSDVLTKLNRAYGVSYSELSARTGMDRNILTNYTHIYTGPVIKPEKLFSPGPDPAKKIWWKKSGKSYRDMWKFAQDISGVKPIATKKDMREIAVEAVNYINAAEEVKLPLLEFIKSSAFNEFQSLSGYRPMAQFPIFFIQWLSEQRGKEVTLNDIDFRSKNNPSGITQATGNEFVEQYVPEKTDPDDPTAPAKSSGTSKAHIRAALRKFFLDLDINGYITSFSMKGMKTGMKRKKNPVVYTNIELDEIFNKILSGQPAYFSLFMRLILQTGSRPGQIFTIKCKDLGFGVPTQDVYDRTFYPINTGDILQQAKERRGEEIKKKYPPGTALISEKMKNDLTEWCKNNNLSSNDYIFQKFISFSGIEQGIRRRVHILSGYKQVGNVWVKDPARQNVLTHDMDFYIPKGMRHTNASVKYNLTLNPKYVTESGGWTSTSNVATDVYTKMMDIKGAYNVFKKYEIYIEPTVVTASGKPFNQHIKEIESGLVGEMEKPGTTVGVVELDKLRAQISEIAKRMEEDRKQLDEERKKRQELEKRFGEKS